MAHTKNTRKLMRPPVPLPTSASDANAPNANKTKTYSQRDRPVVVLNPQTDRAIRISDTSQKKPTTTYAPSVEPSVNTARRAASSPIQHVNNTGTDTRFIDILISVPSYYGTGIGTGPGGARTGGGPDGGGPLGGSSGSVSKPPDSSKHSSPASTWNDNSYPHQNVL
jgi:hypothetical protein